KIEAGQVGAGCVTMKRTVEIGPGVSDHFNLTNLKLSPGRIDLFRRSAGEVIRDHRRRQTLVSDHPVFNGVANINYFVVAFHNYPLVSALRALPDGRASAPACGAPTPKHAS